MIPSSVLQRFGRRVRLGLVGGGRDSVIGRTHLVAMRVDGLCELVAGAMSIDPDVALVSARAELIRPDRIYTDWREMAAREAERDDGIDAVVIATPPQTHLDIARAFLERGIDVLCEKPLCRDLDEAIEFEALVNRHDRVLALAHCYAGYPMVREARTMVAAGRIGRVRLVEAELCAGDPGVAYEPEDETRRHWRFQEASMGKAGLLGEVGSHAQHLAAFVTGLTVEEVSAELTTFAERREVYDNAYLGVRYAGGARGRLWSSYMASGNDHGLSFRIFGELGGLHWHQEDPETLLLKPIGGGAVRVARGHDGLSTDTDEGTRLRAGHPEGYLMAFANLYADFACLVMACRLGETLERIAERLPGVADGVANLSLIDAATRSQQASGAWVSVSSSAPSVQDRPGAPP